MANPRLLVWDADLIARREVRTLTELQQAAGWRRLFRGEITLWRIRAVMRALLLHAWLGVTRLPSILRRKRGQVKANPVDVLLARLRDNGTRVLMAFSDDEPLHEELEQEGFFTRLDRWPNLEVQTLPGRDHTFRPIVAQRGVHAMLDRELTRLLEDVPVTHRDVPTPSG